MVYEDIPEVWSSISVYKPSKQTQKAFLNSWVGTRYSGNSNSPRGTRKALHRHELHCGVYNRVRSLQTLIPDGTPNQGEFINNTSKAITNHSKSNNQTGLHSIQASGSVHAMRAEPPSSMYDKTLQAIVQFLKISFK